MTPNVLYAKVSAASLSTAGVTLSCPSKTIWQWEALLVWSASAIRAPTLFFFMLWLPGWRQKVWVSISSALFPRRHCLLKVEFHLPAPYNPTPFSATYTLYFWNLHHHLLLDGLKRFVHQGDERAFQNDLFNFAWNRKQLPISSNGKGAHPTTNSTTQRHSCPSLLEVRKIQPFP